MEINGAKIEVSNDLCNKIKASLDVLNETFQNYEMNQIFLSFNGGKDCTVLLHLLKEYLNNSMQNLKVIYLRQKCPFPEIESFVSNCENFYNISITTVEVSGSMKEILKKVCDNDRDLVAAIMGCRRTDPYCEKIKFFEPTDQDWPRLMRINPLLEWSCANIWEYLIKNDVPYCPLYNKGFTSIGNMNNTVPNPHLRVNEDEYRPAYELIDDSVERAGRN